MSIKKKKFIFNISPTRVVGAISYFNREENIPVVEYLIEKKINLKKDFSIKDFRKETLKAIDGVCENFISENKIISDKNFFIENVEVFLSAPWVDYENYSLVDESITPFVVNNKYIDNFLLKKSFYKDKDILSSDVVSAQANDYDIDLRNLKEKEVQKISISFLDSFLLKFDKHFIDGAIRNHFPLLDVKINSFIPALFNQIRKIYNPKDNFIFLDISSEITEFGIFNNGSVENMITIPFGINKILNKIVDAKNLKNSYEAKTLLDMYFSENLNSDEANEIKKIIQKNTKLIEKEVAAVFKDNKKISSLNTFVISSSWETNKILKELGLFKNIYFINENLLKNFVEFKTHIFDNFLAAEVEYVYDK